MFTFVFSVLVSIRSWFRARKTDPTKVLARAEKPMFHPVETWEKIGQVPNVVFVEGLVCRGNRWLFYYGGADKHIGVAAAESRQFRPGVSAAPVR